MHSPISIGQHPCELANPADGWQSSRGREVDAARGGRAATTDRRLKGRSRPLFAAMLRLTGLVDAALRRHPQGARIRSVFGKVLRKRAVFVPLPYSQLGAAE